MLGWSWGMSSWVNFYYFFSGYEICLICGLNEYLLSNKRAMNLISQNKEGLFSVFGEDYLYHPIPSLSFPPPLFLSAFFFLFFFIFWKCPFFGLLIVGLSPLKLNFISPFHLNSAWIAKVSVHDSWNREDCLFLSLKCHMLSNVYMIKYA